VSRELLGGCVEILFVTTMSSEYFVGATAIPAGLEADVLKRLANHGFTCEFRPHTKLTDPQLDAVELCVTALPPNTKRANPPSRYLYAAVEYTFAQGADDVGTSRESLNGMGHQPYRFVLRTTAGRSRLQTALQMLIAGAIAEISSGTLFDPQHGAAIPGVQAMAYVSESLSKRSPIFEIREQRFCGW
jgi:hypothetical protein